MEENRKEDGKKTVISMVTYLIANVIGMAVSLVALPILTNLLSTAEMGIATSFITLKNIVTIILLLAMYILQVRSLNSLTFSLLIKCMLL